MASRSREPGSIAPGSGRRASVARSSVPASSRRPKSYSSPPYPAGNISRQCSTGSGSRSWSRRSSPWPPLGERRKESSLWAPPRSTGSIRSPSRRRPRSRPRRSSTPPAKGCAPRLRSPTPGSPGLFERRRSICGPAIGWLGFREGVSLPVCRLSERVGWRSARRRRQDPPVKPKSSQIGYDRLSWWLRFHVPTLGSILPKASRAPVST